MEFTMLPNFGWVRQMWQAPNCEQVMTKKLLTRNGFS
jgi:hypothetical protein